MKKFQFGFLILFTISFMSSSFAADCSGLSAWQSSVAYSGGQQVKHNNNAFKANWWTRGQNPDTHSGPWQEWTKQGSCGGDPTNSPPVAKANGPYAAKENQSIAFSSAGSTDSDGVIVSYEWVFGDGVTSSEANPSHSYSTQGNYSVQLTVTDDKGASSSASTQATITKEGDGGLCNAADYVAGRSYNVGDKVSNVGHEFQCKIAGWCSSNAAWAYEPGVGQYWQDAWKDNGACQGDNAAPIANANGPYAGNKGEAVSFSSAGSKDDDGTIVTFAWTFGDGQSSSTANPTHTYLSGGNFTVSLTVTDDKGASTTVQTVATIQGDGDPGGDIPRRLLVGYWHNFDNGSGYIPMKDVPTAWDFINVSFAENLPGGAEGEVGFEPYGESEQSFLAGVQAQQAKGKKVLISLGGANAHIQLNTTAARDNYIRTLGDIIAKYGFNGMDIDLEGGSLNMTNGDAINNPKTPAIIHLIEATKSLKARFGERFILTMAPETAYVQGGLTNFAGIWGAYLPLIHALRNELTVLHVQHYNTGGLTGTDGNIYNPATVDFHVAMTDMLLTGFTAGDSSSNQFPALRADQVAIGLPSGTQSASSGYTTPANVQRALDCLIKGTNCGNYKPSRTYPDFRGLMTWSINWDKFRGSEFSQPHRQYLDQNP